MKISLTVSRHDGGIVDVELIRPRLWLQAFDISVGKPLPLNIHELQIEGFALVTAIEPCPAISSGEGSVVTGRFVTRQVHRTIRLVVADSTGQTETIEGTAIHPFWSLERQNWVPMGELMDGETLSGRLGPVTILSSTIANYAVPVYNIEVNGEHVYEVSRFCLLVHNTYPGELGQAISRGMKVLEGPSAPERFLEAMLRRGIDLDRYKLGDAIHKAKDLADMGAADDLVFDLSGGLWDSRTGEAIGKIWELL